MILLINPSAQMPSELYCVFFKLILPLMISESTIENCMELLTQGEEDWLHAMSADQPVISSYLTAEDHEAFSEGETQYLYYLAVLCWMCFDHTYTDLGETDEGTLAMREEFNWNRVDALRPTNLKNIIDRILPDYKEPELLYYIEDALQIDEEDPEHPVTKVGQIPLFVTILSIIDALIEASENPPALD